MPLVFCGCGFGRIGLIFTRRHAGHLRGHYDYFPAFGHTHTDPLVRQERWLTVSRAAAWLMLVPGYTVFSPISMGHPICVMEPKLNHSFETWQGISLAMLAQATELIVLLLDGVNTSAGVRAEVAFARERGLPVWDMRPDINTQGAYYLSPQLLDNCKELSGEQ